MKTILEQSLKLLTIAFVLLIGNLSAQNNLLNYQTYYYADGKAHYWEIDSTSAIIIVKNMNNYQDIVNNLQKIFNETEDEVLFDEEEDDINL